MMHLAGIPTDVIRTITRCGQESINDLMLISPRWNMIAHEHLHEHADKLKTIERLTWSVDKTGNYFVAITISKISRSFFRINDTQVIHGKSGRADQEDICIFKDIQLWDIHRMKQLPFILKRCSRVSRLDLDMHLNYSAITQVMKILINTMRDVTIEECAIYKELMNESDPMLQFIREHPVQRLAIIISSEALSRAMANIALLLSICDDVGVVKLKSFEPVISNSNVNTLRHRWESEAGRLAVFMGGTTCHVRPAGDEMVEICITIVAQ